MSKRIQRRQLLDIQAAPAPPGQFTYQMILLLAAGLLLVLPFITTFNEFLTRAVIELRLDRILTDWVVPTEVRFIALILQPLGITTEVTDVALYLYRPGSDFPIPVYISWNCVGWQSFILFGITLVTGLQGSFPVRRKMKLIALGLLGTFWMNLLRMTAVALVAYFFGRLPAVIFHDYGGTLMILIWLAVFWYSLFNYFLADHLAGDEELLNA
ncbi:MAG: exosortase/archaeosortase family protein [Chloroflexi bacterium]|nr:exosortase/archaeosortase family protein [Chloroflexota bacterium]